MASTATYVLLMTLFLTEGGTLEAEQEIGTVTYKECRLEAQRQQQVLRQEFALSKEERGMCPFRDVKVTCQKQRPEK